MDHIHGTNTTWQSCGIVVPIYALQLGDMLRELNILIFHIHHGLDERIEKLAYSEGEMPHSTLQDQNAASIAKRCSADITTTPNACKILHIANVTLVEQYIHNQLKYL
jgi:hypothetical protein